MRTACVALLGAVGLAGAGCDWLEGRLKTCRDIRVDLVNSQQTVGRVQLVGPGEHFTDAAWLESGQARTIGVCVERGERKEFRAGFDGLVLLRQKCAVGEATYRYEGANPRVAWTLRGMFCEGW